MVDSGHSREAVLNYELPYLYAFMDKKLDIIERSKERIKPRETTTRKGRKRTVKRMTSKQMAAKLKAKRK